MVEIGLVRISEKATFRICLGESGACPDFREGKLSNLFGWK